MSEKSVPARDHDGVTTDGVGQVVALGSSIGDAEGASTTTDDLELIMS